MIDKIIFYVSHEGSDDNDGQTASTPFLSIQAAFNALSKMPSNGVEHRIVLGSKVFGSPIRCRNSG
ncbi:MAG: hypothetical protein ACRC62_24835 [Microcoleus sp.]